jgi:hypothetical protein
VCKEQDHKATDCPSKTRGGGEGHKVYGKQNSNKKEFMGTCNNYGKFGHKKSYCWKLEANKNKRTYGYRGTIEQVMAALATTEDDKIEYVLCGIKDDINTDKFEFVDTKVSLCSMHLGDIYDDLIMHEDKRQDDETVMAKIGFPDNIKMLSNPNIWIGVLHEEH